MPGRSANDVHIETYSGPRDDLRRLFELAGLRRGTRRLHRRSSEDTAQVAAALTP